MLPVHYSRMLEECGHFAVSAGAFTNDVRYFRLGEKYIICVVLLESFSERRAERVEC